ncbi:MAG TPA: NAD-dependent epimerase/dehydratase family protein [Methylotenera sp.]|nr:NAD-dependent epimerase/dehydratase family protein [Methylotenera sp.]HPH05282.1 NAD-dependent epimerase/dehydratase family protein [Methylotenera sp.]HPN00184.1 NAD-dependent epimerase/dehydratase family protein [Methylotenera sp.]
MTKALIVGCGDLGQAIATQLASLGFNTFGVRRQASSLAGVHMLQADVTLPASLTQLTDIQPEILIYCVAANGQTDAQYQAHYVEGLRNVLATQADNAQLKHVFFVSSTRVYGQVTDELLDDALINETVPAVAADFGGERLLEAERLLENLPCAHTALRLSGIYGAGRLRMINLAKNPTTWPVQNSWTNRIHRDDAASFMVHLVQQVANNVALLPCYIVTDSAPVSQYEVLQWLAAQQKVAFETKMPPIQGGKRLSNQAMLASGFQLKYPDYRAGYAALLAAESA